MEYPWKSERRFNTYTAFLQEKFGARVQKLSINAGFTCPNRDGTVGTGGCIFCDNEAFSPSYTTKDKSVSQQITEGMEFHSKRYKTDKFFAYFQTYSNTYAPLEKLKTVYEEALAFENVVGLIINTRPDCVDDEKLDYLAELSKERYVMIEYGLESCHDKTLKVINRGHNFETAVEALEKTRERGIPVGAHIVFGLPGETYEDMYKMIDILNKLPIDNVKFHQLQVIKGTKLELLFQIYPKQISNFPTYESYLAFFIPALERLNPNIKIQRVAGEVKKNTIVYPHWGNLRYDQMLNLFEKELERQNTWQGRLYMGS
ncbi:TIGR01212 family radical SAM protein [Bacteroidales bacterium OttesenSCG-928-J16]|nr:TIGR01212 family radical SAM protein [Bacteroidales bacterium OttesenSCG-928-J16]